VHSVFGKINDGGLKHNSLYLGQLNRETDVFMLKNIVCLRAVLFKGLRDELDPEMCLREVKEVTLYVNGR